VTHTDYSSVRDGRAPRDACPLVARGRSGTPPENHDMSHSVAECSGGSHKGVDLPRSSRNLADAIRRAGYLEKSIVVRRSGVGIRSLMILASDDVHLRRFGARGHRRWDKAVQDVANAGMSLLAASAAHRIADRPATCRNDGSVR
jgi:hypothetical protein